MTPLALAPDPARFATQVARYCARAAELSLDASLTTAQAARALDHLADLQREVQHEARRQTQPLRAELAAAEAPFSRLDAALDNARADLSEALLRAKPDRANPFGQIAHGPQPDPVADRKKDTTPTPNGRAQAVSLCRGLLDLEALRAYLPEEALRQAVENYTKDKGACDLRGVAYAVLPASANHPCPVT